MVIHHSHLVRASFNAVFAAYACLRINQDYAVFGGVGGACGADSLTWSVLAMVALLRHVLFVISRVLPTFIFSNSVEFLIESKVVLILARYPTSVATDTLGCVNGYTVTRHY
jgi:hypothetical protein